MAAAGGGGGGCFVLGPSSSSGQAPSFPNVQNFNHPPIIIGPLNHHNNNRRLRQSGGPVRAGPLTKKVCPGFITKQQQQQQQQRNGGGGGSPFSLSFTTNTTDYKKHKNQDPVSCENLDQWMVDSIPEIVRNIGKAPFLIYVYSPMDEEGRWQEIVGIDSWNEIRRSLNERGPDGVILVEELLNKQEDDDDGEGQVEGACSRSKLWGLLIQGSGADDSCSSSRCYILETTRICSTVGFCTHFCLAKAKCFGEAASVQLRNSWLHNK
ncbi:hypothetical protein AMTRI_Chr11g153490 [Amborella trichopoda]|uniref:DUF7804 domain-containing protein n=1 Tax=Amborella trichopoda TaxID=13333 RepID=U5D577_AMBTC|nr:uncharacterized protein LOC18444873 [Amborella trichopoda]XP_020529630.1 uncharacterized protein LOC18444873 [Amborella trichopoda]XP_020529631.1 uncharacterized protein LOC18444873 [Amborella trichopoda]ERN16557.1 hypothetical protein AMTR_s00031p00169100 [Amborella trichopoda]|eukprot:XP_006855090.1 uncharacterized protein LOC18444873 [Amborella trichopoda]